MPEYRQIARSTPAYEGPNESTDVVFNLEPGAVVEVLSKDNPWFFKASHLGHAVYIRFEDAVAVSDGESATAASPAGAGAVPAREAAPAPSTARAPEPPPAVSARCPHCGTEAIPGATFCSICGANLATGEAAPREAAYATFWSRFGASFVDGIIIWVSLFFLGGIAAALSGTLQIYLVLVPLLYIVGPATYYSVMNGNGGTLGKRAFGLRVVSAADARPVGSGLGFVRWLVSVASAIPLFLGYFWMLWDPKRQTWHDKAAGTIVVRA